MPSLEDNKKLWGDDYDWNLKGEEWSDTWGGSDAQWNSYLLPRLKCFIPTDSILEIGCGFGKWTSFIKSYCKTLTAVDLSEKCISYCKQNLTNVNFIKNNGSDLSFIGDSSIEFIFSFDSLVHADASTVNSYLSQFNRILKNNGIAFIHHSNLGSYPYYKIIERIPKMPGLFRRLGMGLHWRDTSVSAKGVREFCESCGLVCISQEILPWDVRKIYTDCISVIVRKDSSWDKDYHLYKNSRYTEEIKISREINNLYFRSKK